MTKLLTLEVSMIAALSAVLLILRGEYAAGVVTLALLALGLALVARRAVAWVNEGGKDNG